MSDGHRRVPFIPQLVFVAFCLAAFAAPSYCQSTFGTVLGTVKDPSGSVVGSAIVKLTNSGTNAVHSAVSNTQWRL